MKKALMWFLVLTVGFVFGSGSGLAANPDQIKVGILVGGGLLLLLIGTVGVAWIFGPALLSGAESVSKGLPHNIAGQAFLAGLHKVFGPLVVKALRNAFSATQLSNAVFASQAIQDNTDLFLRTVLLARLALDVSDSLF